MRVEAVQARVWDGRRALQHAEGHAAVSLLGHRARGRRPPQMAAAIAEQGQGPSAAAAGAVLPVAQVSISAPEDNPLQSPMQCD